MSLNGDQALAYARSRALLRSRGSAEPGAVAAWNYTTSTGGDRLDRRPAADLDRIPRQQYFLRTLSQTAIDKTGSDPLKIIGLLDAVFKSLGARPDPQVRAS